MKSASKLIKSVSRSVRNVAYGNPIYQKMLAAGETPEQLHFTPADLWPGDATAGQRLLSGQTSMFDKGESTALRHAATTLRNLRALGTEAAKGASVKLIDDWLRQFDGWHETEWTAARIGARISAWIGFYSFYASAASPDFTRRLVASLHRQWKHLEMTLSPSLTGVESIEAIRGLIYGGLNFPEGDKALGLACELLQRQLTAEILPDGGHISRSPSAQLHILRHLVDIRNMFDQAGIRLPEDIGMALGAMIPAVKLFRHGDGGLALFHGAVEETPLLIDAVLTQATTRGRVLRRLVETGYERVTAGRSLLLVDVGAPPQRAFGHDGHAGLLSFEFSVGKERLIVNCGGAPHDVLHGLNEWRAACAATAAHSTITVGDTNACDIDRDGGILGSALVSAQRFEEGGVAGIEVAHDGYRGRFGLIHNRILRLSGDGETLAGRDILQGKEGRAFTLRWHLHPSIQASLSQDGQTALLRTPSGLGWRLRVERRSLSIESSIYCGGSSPRRTTQIKTDGVSVSGDTVITWSLSRERKA